MGNGTPVAIRRHMRAASRAEIDQWRRDGFAVDEDFERDDYARDPR